MKGAILPRGDWATSPLSLFHRDRVQARTDGGDWITGVLTLLPGGLELQHDEPRAIQGHVESSRVLAREEAEALRAVLRPEALWTDELRARREEQIWGAAHPNWRQRMGRWTRELFGCDPVSAEPLLRRHLGRPVVVETGSEGRAIFASGLLLAYDREFLALADAVLPSETSLPLCPGRTTGADLEILWNDEGLELFNRGAMPVEIRGIRTAEGIRDWELTLQPGFRERIAFRRAPAGTAEIVFESPARGDAVLSRRFAKIRGSAEGSVAIPGLPDPSTRFGDLAELREPGREESLVAFGADRD